MRIVALFKKWNLRGMVQRVRDEMENQKENREVIGEDRFGNKYYQYYSFYGLPTRR